METLEFSILYRSGGRVRYDVFTADTVAAAMERLPCRPEDVIEIESRACANVEMGRKEAA